MANISSLLEIIRTAHLGRDMRQALHDSIQAVNNDTENALGKSLTFTNATRKLSLKANDGTVLSEATIPGGGSGGGSVDTVNGVAPDENGNVQLTASDVGAMSSSAGLNDISDVTLSSPSNGQVLGYDGSKWKNVSGGSGGGHTIKNESGTALTQRDNLQFKGCAVSDDSTNNATVVSVQTSNRNLLDNPWFTVNQKGVTSGTFGSDSILIDRWHFLKRYTSGASYSLTSDGLMISNVVDQSTGGYMKQYFEKSLIGKTITFSILYSDGTISSATRTLTGTAYVLQDGKITLRYVDNTDYSLWVYFETNCTIRAIKLELGTESTLTLDVAPNYTEELLKCQRYYYPLANKEFVGYKEFNSSGLAKMIIDIPTEMRTTPTISLSGNVGGVAYTSGDNTGIGRSYTISYASISTMAKNQIIASVSYTGSLLPNWDYKDYSSICFNNITGYLSAEL